MPTTDTERAIEAVWRIESARLIAGLARIVRDVGLAEELAQDALVAALEQWPVDGVPANPGAWLMATAKHRAHRPAPAPAGCSNASTTRSAATWTSQHRSALADLAAMPRDDDVGDDLLRLIFTACHPVLSHRRAGRADAAAARRPDDRRDRARLPGARVDDRAADRPRQADAGRGPRPVRGPERRGARRPRLASVLEVVYLIFNEGYAATRAPTGCGPALCDDALRLGRILAGLAPDEPEVHGLVALMEIQASRLARARRARPASRSCCWTRTARAGTSC